MKKKIIMLLLTVFMFIPFSKVNALELTQEMFDTAKNAGTDVKVGNITYKGYDSYYLDADDYTIGDDITVHIITFNGGESTLNINNKNINGIIITEGAKLTIEGDGSIGALGVYSGDYDGLIGSDVLIKGGTFIDIDVTDSKLVIENVNVEGEYHGITANSGADIEINGGTVTVGPEGKALEVGSHYSEHAKVTVNGGTFSGGEYGLYVLRESYDQLSLLGGTFKGSIAAIGFKSSEATSDEPLKTSIRDILKEGYTYSPQMTSTTQFTAGNWIAKTDQKELSVVPKTSDDSEESVVPTTTTSDEASNTTNNPQTGDNIMFYISMLGLSLIGLTGTGIYLKKKRTN